MIMTIENNEAQQAKLQALRLFDDFEDLHLAYEALQVICVGSVADSVHVGRVINVLNYRFESILDELRRLSHS